MHHALKAFEATTIEQGTCKEIHFQMKQNIQWEQKK